MCGLCKLLPAVERQEHIDDSGFEKASDIFSSSK